MKTEYMKPQSLNYLMAIEEPHIRYTFLAMALEDADKGYISVRPTEDDVIFELTPEIVLANAWIVLYENEKAVKDYRKGKKPALNRLVGGLIKCTGLRIAPEDAKQVMLEELKTW